MSEQKDKIDEHDKNVEKTKHQHKENEKVEQTIPLSKYDELKKQATTYLNTARQLQADFDNYKRHNKDAKVEGIEEGVLKVCETILPALDSFKKAKQLVSDKNCLNGINMIENTLINDLEKLKIKRISAIGEEFNPDLHNAVIMIEDDKTKSNFIIEEIQAGYTYKDKVIRYSQVIVAK